MGPARYLISPSQLRGRYSPNSIVQNRINSITEQRQPIEKPLLRISSDGAGPKGSRSRYLTDSLQRPRPITIRDVDLFLFEGSPDFGREFVEQ